MDIQSTEVSPDLRTNPWAALEDKADPSIPTATLQVYGFINEYLTREQSTHVNRASSAPQCYKRRWYQKNGYPGEQLTPRKQVNFLLGDLSERSLLYFIKQACVGPGKLYSEVDFGKSIGSIHFQGKEIEIYKQEDLSLKVGGVEITAHVDGWGKRNSDGGWENIECKSAANYGFKDFKTIGPKEYLKQAHVVLRTEKAIQLGADGVRYFYLRKETGHIWDRYYAFDEALWQDVKAEFELANQAEEPKAPYRPEVELNRGKPTGRTIGKFPCTYCPYIKTCLGDYEVDWKADPQFGFLKPVYVFKRSDS